MGRSVISGLAHVLAARPVSAPAAAQQAPPHKSVFDGQWSLIYRIATGPGGGIYTTPAATNQIVYYYLAKKTAFQLKQGAFAWEERNDVSHHSEHDSQSHSGDWGRATADYQGAVRASGSGEEQSRSLKLNLQWATTSGHSHSHFNKGKPANVTMVVSPDLATTTGTLDLGGTVTNPVVFTGSAWTLAPESIEREDIGTDVERETVTYSQSRQTNLPLVNVPATEEIEIKQVRYVKLVPRG